MASSRARKRQQRWVGFIPRLWRSLMAGARWALRHPQPAMIALVFGVVTWAMWSFAQRADAFKVTSVVLPTEVALEVPPSLVGQNLWRVNLRELSNRLQRQRPEMKEVRVIRQLPNVIKVHAIARTPVAQVRLDRWYAVDREGFILPAGSAEPLERLVRLAGVGRGETPLKVGRLNTDERLQLALRVLPTLQRARALSSRRVVELNVADVQQIRFVLDTDVEIRCGGEAELDTHLARLQATMKTLARRPSMPIRYIDVRFHDPVVGPQASP